MFRLRCAHLLLCVSLIAVPQYAQEKQPATKATPAKDIDPLALDVLRAVAQPVEEAQAFNFKALVSEEDSASDGQILTFFHSVDVTVQRPNKIHLVYHGNGQQVDFYLLNGTVTMWAPDPKLYASLPAKPTIDAGVMDVLHKGFDMPIGPFLLSNFYDLAAKAVTTGYVIGRVKIYDQNVHQLAFTAPDADWQLWVTGGPEPRIVRAEVVNKKLEGKPRTIIQFLDWDLKPNIAPDEFTFTKPSDAQEINFLPTPGGK
jgi:hypothetical protein